MCGRYSLKASPQALQEEFALSEAPTLAPRFNIAPTQEVAAILNHPGPRTLSLVRWGLVPPWATDAAVGSKHINARAETLAHRPTFREAFRLRRCLVLADGFYEWKGAAPMHIRKKSGRPFAFAGLWEQWKAPGGLVTTCAIVTTRASPLLAEVHARMPVILSAAQYGAWLCADAAEPAELMPLLAPVAEDLEIIRVSRRVNSIDNDSPDCLAPPDPDRQLTLL